MALVKWDPFQDLISLEERINRIFSGSLYPGRGKMHGASGFWMPAVDISETEEAIIFRAELPGVTRQDISLVVERQKIVTLRGVRKDYYSKDSKRIHRIERIYGSFERSFELPVRVDTQAVSAKLEDGVLIVVLPKLKNLGPFNIDIQEE